MCVCVCVLVDLNMNAVLEVSGVVLFCGPGNAALLSPSL